MSYDYPVTIQVPGTTTTSALETYLQSDAGQSALAVSLAIAGYEIRRYDMACVLCSIPMHWRISAMLMHNAGRSGLAVVHMGDCACP